MIYFLSVVAATNTYKISLQVCFILAAGYYCTSGVDRPDPSFTNDVITCVCPDQAFHTGDGDICPLGVYNIELIHICGFSLWSSQLTHTLLSWTCLDLSSISCGCPGLTNMILSNISSPKPVVILLGPTSHTIFDGLVWAFGLLYFYSSRLG